MTSTSPEPPPLPPSDLSTRAPIEVEVKQGATLHRFFTAVYDPIYYDRGRGGRLNAPDDSYGVLYAAKGRRGAFAETFLRTPGRTLLDPAMVALKRYVALRALRSMKFIKLGGPGLARLGATAQVVHGGKPYDAPQAWSGAIHKLSQNYDGIAYNARHDDEALCYAIFERASGAVEQKGKKLTLDRNWFWDIADVYGVGIAPGP